MTLACSAFELQYIRLVMEDAKFSQQNLFMLKLDFSSAFDTVESTVFICLMSMLI